jgi:kinesin family protein 11
MELYNEELTDLLSIDNDKEKRLRLLEDRSGVVVQGLEEMVVKSAAGVWGGVVRAG